MRALAHPGAFWGSPGQHLEATIQDSIQVPLLEDGVSGQVFEEGYGWGDFDEAGGSNDEDSESLTVAGPKKPNICGIGSCLRSRMDSRELWRHRDTHFKNRYGFQCPNKTCPSNGHNFGRKDRVLKHCSSYESCGEALEANKRKVPFWGERANLRDLWLHDQAFDIVCEEFNTGRARRDDGEAA
jgi:hypothetical protein